MYIPHAFRETRPEVLRDLIRRHSFGTLVSQVDGELFATHLPFLLEPERGPHGTLVAHMARANPHWQSFPGGGDVLVIFQGSHAYISPSWYSTEVAVPTWNYVAVHASGRARTIADPAAARRVLEKTVDFYEASFEQPWTMDGLPEEYVDKMAANVVAFEVEITRLEGKLKLSQNRSLADRKGVIAALRDQGDANATAVAAMMEDAVADVPGDNPIAERQSRTSRR